MIINISVISTNGHTMGNKKKVYIFKGIRLKSDIEYALAEQLSKLKKIKWMYEPLKYVIRWTPPEKKYKADFVIEKKDGSIIYIEAKGSRFWPGDIQKFKAIRNQYPDLDIRFVWDNAHRPTKKGSKETCAEWCNRNGYMYTSGGSIPPEWLK